MSSKSVALLQHGAVLQSYVLSLSYLREEARREGLEEVETIMHKALADLSLWVDKKPGPHGSHELLDVPFCQAVDFLLRFYSLPRHRQKDALRIIERYEDQALLAAVGSQKRINKKKAN